MDEGDRPKRSATRGTWFRYSLRGLMAVTCLIGVWLGFWSNGVREQKSAITAITAVDGYYYYGFQRDGETYSQNEHPSGPEWLWAHVDLDYTCNVVAVGLNCKPSTDETLHRLAELPHLEVLDLTNTRITDRGLADVGKLKGLKYLRLDGTETTDAGLVHLRHLTHLETLMVSCKRVTDAGIEHLTGLRQLQILDLSGTNLTDEGLTLLRTFRHLKELNLTETRVSDEAVTKLRHVLPNCTIWRHPPTDDD